MTALKSSQVASEVVGMCALGLDTVAESAGRIED
jgi:hypothetical protein